MSFDGSKYKAGGLWSPCPEGPVPERVRRVERALLVSDILGDLRRRHRERDGRSCLSEAQLRQVAAVLAGEGEGGGA